MNKIEQLHYSSVVNIYLDAFKVGGSGRMDCEKAAIQAATISEQIAVEFSEWQQELLFSENSEWLIDKTTKDLFQEFLKAKQ